MSKIEELLRAELEKLSSVRERFAQRFGVNGTGAMKPAVGRMYRHVRTGRVYTVLALARHTERDEPLVVYMDAADVTWARPLEMFCDGRFVDAEEGKRP